MEIQGSIALVTGAAQRIGRATALALASRGARVAIHYRASAAAAVAAVQEVEARGGEAAAFQADLVVDADRGRLFQEIEARFGGLDILVNNASEFEAGTLEAATPRDWDRQMDANAKAPFFVAQAAARLMRRGGRGKIVNLADPAGESIWPAYFPYSVSKAAVLAVTRGLAKSLAPAIQVSAVAPGPVHFPPHYTEAQKRFAIERTLLKRAGSPDDVVRAILFLIENDYITGEVLHVDGGRHVM